MLQLVGQFRSPPEVDSYGGVCKDKDTSAEHLVNESVTGAKHTQAVVSVNKVSMLASICVSMSYQGTFDARKGGFNRMVTPKDHSIVCTAPL